MTFWLANVAAYSVQLAALVSAAVVITTLLRLDGSRAALRFWQAVLATGVVWPGLQLLEQNDTAFTPSRLTDGMFVGAVTDAASSKAAAVLANIVRLDSDVAALVAAILTAGVVIRVGLLGVGFVRARRILDASEQTTALAPVVDALKQELGVTADVRLSDAVDGPATIGGWRPTVLLPREVIALPPAVQRAVLCHELIHVRRRDWLAVLGEELWCAVLWFHPFARVLASRVGLAREAYVDRATIAHTRDKRAYAAALLAFSSSRTELAGAPALIGRRQIAQRIELLTQEASMLRIVLVARIAAASVAVTLVTIATTACVPVSAAQASSAKVYKPRSESGVTLPRPVTEVKPTYTAKAMKARVQGTVWMQVVVLPSGDVGDVTVVKSLDKEYGLDGQAVDAMRQWKFQPGEAKGKPVPVEVTVEMTFTLK